MHYVKNQIPKYQIGSDYCSIFKRFPNKIEVKIFSNQLKTSFNIIFIALIRLILYQIYKLNMYVGIALYLYEYWFWFVLILALLWCIFIVTHIRVINEVRHHVRL